MTSTVIRILAGLVLSIAASQAAAQTSSFSMDYRWLTLFGEIEQSVPARTGDRTRQQSALENILGRAFVSVESDYRPSDTGYGDGFFRGQDPEFGRPVAFQRPRQARLSFSIRF